MSSLVCIHLDLRGLAGSPRDWLGSIPPFRPDHGVNRTRASEFFQLRWTPMHADGGPGRKLGCGRRAHSLRERAALRAVRAGVTQGRGRFSRPFPGSPPPGSGDLERSASHHLGNPLHRRQKRPFSKGSVCSFAVGDPGLGPQACRGPLRAESPVCGICGCKRFTESVEIRSASIRPAPCSRQGSKSFSVFSVPPW